MTVLFVYQYLYSFSTKRDFKIEDCVFKTSPSLSCLYLETFNIDGNKGNNKQSEVIVKMTKGIISEL